MDSIEAEENQHAVSDAKLHSAMCKQLSTLVYKVLGIFPVLEAARPGSKSGIQALSSLHVAINKAKSLLRHCSECSKLYLAVTAESELAKFEMARCALAESLRRVEGIVPQAIGSQFMDIVGELEAAIFTLDQSEKKVGEELIALLQKEKQFSTSNSNDLEELEIFHQAAVNLCITTSSAAVAERRALKCLLETACGEGDKRKESIVAYLLHLMRKYSKALRNDVPKDTDSQGTTPPSPTVLGQAFDRQMSRFNSVNSTCNRLEPVNPPIPPEELRCPISLQLMYDPVVISTGQTYERVCIEKWLRDGHTTCPKTGQQLPSLCITPNYCVKGLIASWCDQNGVPVPAAPPEPLDLDYWMLTLSVLGAACPNSMEENGTIENLKADQSITLDDNNDNKNDEDSDDTGMYENLLAALTEDTTVEKQRRTVEQIRFILKDDEAARTYMGENGFVEALVQFLRSAVHEGDKQAQETGAMAIFNLAVNNKRNKEKLIAAGVLNLIDEMTKDHNVHEAAAAVYLNLSCLDEAKPPIGSSQAVPFLIQLLQEGSSRRSSKHDAMYALYNLSTDSRNISSLVSAGIINCLHSFIMTNTAGSCANMWTEKALAVLINIASSSSARKEIFSTAGLIGTIAGILDGGEPLEQEQAASCFLMLCDSDSECRHMVLQEGVIPSLVSLSVNGTPRGRDKAQKLLKLFREQRQREHLQPQEQLQQARQLASDGGGGEDFGSSGGGDKNAKGFIKLRSRRLGRALSQLWKLRRSLKRFS